MKKDDHARALAIRPSGAIAVTSQQNGILARMSRGVLAADRSKSAQDNGVRFRTLMLAALGASLFFVKWYVREILLENAQNNLYPPEADSISIPIFATDLQLTAILMFSIFGLFISKKWLWSRVIAGSFMFLAILQTLGGVVEWTIPNHYKLALSYLPVVSILVISAIYVFWFEKNSSQQH